MSTNGNYVVQVVQLYDNGDYREPEYEMTYPILRDALMTFVQREYELRNSFHGSYNLNGYMGDFIVSLTQEVLEDLNGDGTEEVVDYNELMEARYTYADFLRDEFIDKILNELPDVGREPMTKEEYDQHATEALRDFVAGLE